ncbi:MAG: hypothetical protein EPO26_17220 [Chloroflexota bacterium]|nr:MAG: hypothetical protein EPO26_17220 [Chloroflexota bacterium]
MTGLVPGQALGIVARRRHLRRVMLVGRLVAGVVALALSGCSELSALAMTPVSGASERGTFVGVLSTTPGEPRPTPPERPTPQRARVAEPARLIAAAGTIIPRTPTVARASATPSPERSPSPTRAATRAGSPVASPTLGLGAVALPTLPPIPTVARLFAGSPTVASGPTPVGSSASPIDRMSCPPSHPIKGLISAADRRYYLPIHVEYRTVAPTQCFASEALAAANGYTRGRR